MHGHMKFCYEAHGQMVASYIESSQPFLGDNPFIGKLMRTHVFTFLDFSCDLDLSTFLRLSNHQSFITFLVRVWLSILEHMLC